MSNGASHAMAVGAVRVDVSVIGFRIIGILGKWLCVMCVWLPANTS